MLIVLFYLNISKSSASTSPPFDSSSTDLLLGPRLLLDMFQIFLAVRIVLRCDALQSDYTKIHVEINLCTLYGRA